MSTNSLKAIPTHMSRRRFLESASTAGLTALTASLALITPAYAKVAKQAVMYQDSPKGPRKCSGCKFFQSGQSTCERVEGQISPNGWCAIWQKK